jgi:hypothetical protein
MPSISITLPAGSEVQTLVSNYTHSFYADAGLNDLANAASTPSITYSSPSGSSAAKVLVTLGSITLGSSGTLALDNGTDMYEITVPSGSGARRIEFNDIPSSFLSSFFITNSLGVALASDGNSVTIVPL